jgi:membrane associated rhomboid family serine protease
MTGFRDGPGEPAYQCTHLRSEWGMGELLIDTRARAEIIATMSSSPPATTAAAPPTQDDLLRHCAAADPGLWFPSEFAAREGIPRDSLDEPLWALRQAGLVHVADWVRGKGQGYALTLAGRQALAGPEPPRAEEPPVEKAAIPEPKPLPRIGLTAYDRGELTREAFLDPRATHVVPALIVVHLGWFIVGLAVAWRLGVPVVQYLSGGSGPVLLRIRAADAAGLRAGELWRLATSGFAHPGVVPLIASLFALAAVGPVAEGLWGRWRFAAMYLLAALASAAAALAFEPGELAAGAAGAVGGVVLAVVAWLVRYHDHLPGPVVSSWTRRLGLVIALLLAIAIAPGLAWEGRVAGAAVGARAGGFFDHTPADSGRIRHVVGALGITMLVLINATLFVAALRAATTQT